MHHAQRNSVGLYSPPKICSRRRNSCSGLQLFPLLARICCSAILFPLVANRVCFIAQFNHRGCSACFFTSCCLFSTALLTLFDVLLNMIVLHDGQTRSQSSAGTPSRAVASTYGVKRNACVCVAALSVRLLFCPVGCAAVFFACSSSAQLSLFFPAAVLVVASTAVFFVCATADALPLQ
jgi:hypothetical protein